MYAYFVSFIIAHRQRQQVNNQILMLTGLTKTWRYMTGQLEHAKNRNLRPQQERWDG